MMKLRIYEVALRIVAAIARLATRVQRWDRDLARQMRRASTSIPLNLAEGVHSRGGNQLARFQDAMASARETTACLQVCVAAGYLETDDDLERLLDELDQTVATTWKILHRR